MDSLPVSIENWQQATNQEVNNSFNISPKGKKQKVYGLELFSNNAEVQNFFTKVTEVLVISEPAPHGPTENYVGIPFSILASRIQPDSEDQCEFAYQLMVDHKIHPNIFANIPITAEPPKQSLLGGTINLNPYWYFVTKFWHDTHDEQLYNLVNTFDGERINGYYFDQTQNILLFKLLTNKNVINLIKKVEAYFGRDFNNQNLHNKKSQFVTCLKVSSNDIKSLLTIILDEIKELLELFVIHTTILPYIPHSSSISETDNVGPDYVIFEYLQACPPTCPGSGGGGG